MRAYQSPEERKLRALERQYSQLDFDYDSLLSEQEGLKRRIGYYHDELTVSTSSVANYEIKERMRKDEERLEQINDELEAIRQEQEDLQQKIDSLNEEIDENRPVTKAAYEEPVTEEDLDSLDLAVLRDKMNKYFSLSELHNICFDMGIDYEDLAASSKMAFTRELIVYTQRRGQLNDLIEELRKARPKVAWP